MAANYQHPYYATMSGDELIDEEIAKAMVVSSLKSAKAAVAKAAIRKLSGCLLKADFKKAIETWIPRCDDPLAHEKILPDSVFRRISDLLAEFGKKEWSYRPRTFSLLWMIGVPEGTIDSFLADGRTDHYLPYDDGNLPDIIKGASLRAKFLLGQKMVRCNRKEDVAELEAGGKHIVLLRDVDSYFQPMGVLGQGRFAKVEKVYSCQTTYTYARKQIRRGQSVLEDKTHIDAFEKELQSLKRLSHRHIVRLVGSYTHSSHLGLIMSPVADMDLYQYLKSSNIEPEFRKRTLRNFYGCLTTALAYIHAKNVRHKDIKPSNVLVHDGNVLLADFGTSRVCLDGHLTTNGDKKDGTPRYWAPEVVDSMERNAASDIWSLGCVFLEMATVLFGHREEDMLEFYQDHGTGNPWRICMNEEATDLWIKKLRGSSLSFDCVVLDWISDMLKNAADDRPSAKQLRGRIIDADTPDGYICHGCACSDDIDNSKSPAPLALADSTITELIEPQDIVAEPEEIEATLTVEVANSEAPQFAEEAGADALLQVKAKAFDLPEYPPSPPLSPPANPTLGHTDENEVQEVPLIQLPQREHRPYHIPDLAQKTKVRKRVTFKEEPTVLRFSEAQTTKADTDSERFNGLPEQLRPEPTSRQSSRDEDDDEMREFIAPDPIQPPPLHKRDCTPLPMSSLVPSYILAGTNHFSDQELEERVSTKNLFVYGRLMFPAVLNAIATQSIGGVYSPILQRRILPHAADWNSANISIQRASENMTPALLRGYDRWRPTGLECAVIQSSARTPTILRRRESDGGYNPLDPPGNVVGFLIKGLSMEAIRYLDLLFASSERNLDGLKPRVTDEETDGHFEDDSPLERVSVSVSVESSAGEMITVPAETYAWGLGVTDLWVPWSEDRFVRGKSFQRLMNDHQDARRQETALAKRMRMSYALIGDFLCRAIMSGDMMELQRLLRKGYDPNASCRTYGNPLQAAVVAGSEDMVQLLIDHRANVNARGGQYGTPLIAAAYASRKPITRVLLECGADVFVKHVSHVNALYQAVGHADYAITEMLLDHGAWLVEDWGEICDLAEEKGDTEITHLLRMYDVRQQHMAWKLANPNAYLSLPSSSTPGLDSRPMGTNKDQNKVSYSRIVQVVLGKCATVHTMSGRWRGRRGVAVVVAALNAGAPLAVLPMLRNAIGPVRALLDVLRKIDQTQQEAQNGKLIEDGDKAEGNTDRSTESGNRQDSREEVQEKGAEKPRYRDSNADRRYRNWSPRC